MSLAPKWARPVAMLGLDIQLTEMELKYGVMDAEMGRAKVADLRRRLNEIPRD